MDERGAAARRARGVRTSIVLARLIAPAEFGVTVVAVFAAAVGQSVAVQGIGSSSSSSTASQVTAIRAQRSSSAS